MALPNFVVLGPPRTATTWLFTCLTENKRIGLSNMKEVRFFDERYDRGVDWYKSQFDGMAQDCSVIGDITPGYFSHPQVPDRLVEVLGTDIDLFVVDRDPVDRAFSEYRGMLRRGETQKSFESTLRSSKRLVANSSYANQTRRYIDRFGVDRVHVLDFKKIAECPADVIEQVCGVLKVPVVESTKLHSPVNVGMPPAKFRSLRSLISRVRQGVEGSKIGRDVLWAIRRNGLISKYHQATANASESNQDLVAEDLARCREFFDADQQQWRMMRTQLGMAIEHRKGPGAE